MVRLFGNDVPGFTPLERKDPLQERTTFSVKLLGELMTGELKASIDG